MTERHQCHFCKKEFTRVKSLEIHLCEQKRRWMNKDDKAVRIAYASWLHWCKKSGLYMTKKTPLSYEDFMKSTAYTSFVKFGHFVDELSISNYLAYIDFMIKNNYRMNMWTKDSIYEHFIKMNVRQESVEDAIQRTIKFMDKWSADVNEEWTDFFIKITNQEALDWLRSGRISPWIFFTSEKAQSKINDMTDEQLLLLDKYLDVKWWNQNLRRKLKEKQFVEQIVKEYEI